MTRMTRLSTPSVTPFIRRLVLGSAFAIAIALALAPRMPEVHAQETRPAPAADAKSQPTTKTITISREPGVGAKIEIKDSTEAASGANPSANSNANPSTDAGADASGTPPAGAKAGSGGKGARKSHRVVVEGIGPDHEFGSFDEFARDEPAIARMVAVMVAVIFLSPVLAIGLVLWYRFRKARMLNETMVKLAEKGVMPSAETIDALASGSRGSRVTVTRDPAPAGGASSAAATAGPATRIVIGRGGKWSDLRKGVFMGGIGLALTFYSMLGGHRPNVFGLILLFVGIGFVVLWWLEERKLAPWTATAAAPATPAPAPGSTGPAGSGSPAGNEGGTPPAA